jgi:hypothetical protein
LAGFFICLKKNHDKLALNPQIQGFFMKVRTLKSFISANHGNLSEGEVIEVSPNIGIQWAQSKMVEIINQEYSTKVIQNRPKIGDIPLASGPVSESLSSPAVPASTKPTAKASRKKKQS